MDAHDLLIDYHATLRPNTCRPTSQQSGPEHVHWAVMRSTVWWGNHCVLTMINILQRHRSGNGSPNRQTCSTLVVHLLPWHLHVWTFMEGNLPSTLVVHLLPWHLHVWTFMEGNLPSTLVVHLLPWHLHVRTFMEGNLPQAFLASPRSQGGPPERG